MPNNAPRPKPIAIAGLFSTASGIGALARDAATALRRHGHEPYCIDLSARLRQQDMVPSEPYYARPPSTPGSLIVCLNAPETARGLFDLRLWRGSSWHVIGYWAWELECLPLAWCAGARHLDEVWGCSSFVTEAIRKSIAAPAQTVLPMVEAPNALPNRAAFGLPEDACVCLTAADGRSSFGRKNIAASLAMFRAAATGRPQARLLVKTRNLALFPEFASQLSEASAADPRITILEGALSKAVHAHLLASVDIVLSPHRAEGFGYLVAEGMAYGKAVIATGWSGNMDFMAKGTVLELPYTLIPIADPFGVYTNLPKDTVWAEPDNAVGVQHLRTLIDDRALRERLGAAACAHVSERLDGRDIVTALGLTTASSH